MPPANDRPAGASELERPWANDFPISDTADTGAGCDGVARVDLRPQVVRNKLVRLGAASNGSTIFRRLVESIEADWSIIVGRPFAGGTESFVAEAILGDGTPAALKLLDSGHERCGHAQRVRALRLTRGDGCVLLS